MGDQLNTALASELVRDSPDPNAHHQLPQAGETWHELTTWRDTLVPEAYANGYALHLVVADWDTDDPEVPVETKYGPACGRTHPLSKEFLEHMRALARTFAGKLDDPPLYVTMFQEVNNFACGGRHVQRGLPRQWRTTGH